MHKCSVSQTGGHDGGRVPFFVVALWKAEMNLKYDGSVEWVQSS
jgi:hypothetical protein